MKITIQWLWDDHECETCGFTGASGAMIKMDDKKLLLEPVAHCFDGESWTEVEVFTAILKELGHEVEIVGE